MDGVGEAEGEGDEGQKPDGEPKKRGSRRLLHIFPIIPLTPITPIIFPVSMRSI